MSGARAGAVLIAATLAATSFGAVGYAAGASLSDSLTACAIKSTGVLRLLSKGRCSKGERAVRWSVTGPTGADGATGPAGAAGVTGSVGANGATGSAGAAGAAGAPGATGPSDGYQNTSPISVALNNSDGTSKGYVSIASLTLPVGSYLISGSTIGDWNGGSGFPFIQCQLLEVGVAQLALRVASPADSGSAVSASVDLHAALTLSSPTVITMRCLMPDGNDGSHQGSAYDGSLQAIKVGTLHVTAP